jgi:hypothetical protein
MARRYRRPAARLASIPRDMSMMMLLLLLCILQANAVSSADNAVDVSISEFQPSAVEVYSIQRQPETVQAIAPLPQHLNFRYWHDDEANRNSELLRQLCGRPLEDRQVVEALTVDRWQSFTNWTEVQYAFHCLPNIEDIYWQSDGLMPKISRILSEYLPTARLHLISPDTRRSYSEAHYPDRKRSNRYLELMGSPALASVKMSIIYEATPAPQPMIDLHRLLTSCANVTSLDLELGHEGCVVTGGQPQSFNFEDRQVFRARCLFSKS